MYIINIENIQTQKATFKFNSTLCLMKTLRRKYHSDNLKITIYEHSPSRRWDHQDQEDQWDQ